MSTMIPIKDLRARPIMNPHIKNASHFTFETQRYDASQSDFESHEANARQVRRPSDNGEEP